MKLKAIQTNKMKQTNTRTNTMSLALIIAGVALWSLLGGTAFAQRNRQVKDTSGGTLEIRFRIVTNLAKRDIVQLYTNREEG